MQIEAVQCIWNPILVWHRPFHKSLSSDCSECSVSHRQSEAVFQKHSSQLNSPPVQPEVRGCSNHLKHFQVAQDDRVLLLQWRENRHNTCSWRRSQRCFAAKVSGKTFSRWPALNWPTCQEAAWSGPHRNAEVWKKESGWPTDWPCQWESPDQQYRGLHKVIIGIYHPHDLPTQSHLPTWQIGMG